MDNFSSNERWLLEPRQANSQVSQAISRKTYVGIDFGTSTTVASMVTVDYDGLWSPEALEIRQHDDLGGCTEQSIVNTVLLWKNDQLLFGYPAYRYKAKAKPGRNLFSSFKMELGVDLGPTFPETALSARAGKPFIIETAAQAAGNFFKLLVDGIKNAVRQKGAPASIEYVVSVPASFQDSQRKDLLEALRFAGISVESSSFIDEPNAAFLSYFYESWKEEHGLPFLEALKASPINVLVYDFGAGTCDISILRVGFVNGKLTSRNLSISKFTALGGDNIDKAIAENILYEQIQWESIDDEYIPTDDVKNETIIPRLMPIAERLKISMVNWLITQGVGSVYELKKFEHTVSEKTAVIAKGERVKAVIDPQMSMQAFQKVMLKFVGEEDSSNASTHVCGPIHDAIEKADISLDDLYGVLFIGGSCENPLVRSSVMGMMPDGVTSMIPYDLRTHVSQGAAIHCLGYHAFGYDFIQPVTSETISIVTSGEQLRALIKESTPVPSERFELTLQVPRDKQKEIDIPICLSSSNHILDVLKMYAPDSRGFACGETVTVTGLITREKMLDVKVFMRGKEIKAALLAPMSTEPMSPAKEHYLKAQKKFREECLRVGKKNIPEATIDALIDAAKKCDYYNEVVDLYRHKDTCTGRDCSTSITYYASVIGNMRLRHTWAKIAVDRNPCAVNLFNYSLDFSGIKKIELLRKALQDYSEHVPSLIELGVELSNQGDSEGKILLKKAHELLVRELDLDIINQEYCNRLRRICRLLDDKETLRKVEKKLDKFSASMSKQKQARKQYDEKNLLVQGDLNRLTQTRLI